jgi:putative PIN family toxin of toxin-antitoxin system
VRVVIDANVFLRYLIYPQKPTSVVRLVVRVIAGDFVLVFPDGVAAEMRQAVREKPYFRDRIDEAVLEDFLSLIAEIAIPPSAGVSSPVVSRDPKDQYLLDAAAGDGVEFLITGDTDLLDIGRKAGVPLIVSPAQFLYLMESMPQPEK